MEPDASYSALCTTTSTTTRQQAFGAITERPTRAPHSTCHRRRMTVCPRASLSARDANVNGQGGPSSSSCTLSNVCQIRRSLSCSDTRSVERVSESHRGASAVRAAGCLPHCQCCGHEPGKQRVRPRGARAELRVRLGGHVVGMHIARQLHELDEAPIR